MTPLVLIAAAPATEPSSVAEAESAWAAGDYETAADRWAEAYAETGEIRHVFARGQALAKLGRCEEAIEVLEAFVATKPKEVAATAAQETIAWCRERLPEPEPEPEPAPAPEPVPSGNAPPPQTEAAPMRWFEDPAGGVLLAGGAVTLGLGGVLAGVARTQRRQAEASSELPTFARHDDRAVTLSRVSVPVLVVGGALVVGAVIRYVVVARRRTSTVAWDGFGVGRF